MKAGFCAVSAMLIGVTLLPVLLTNGDPPPLQVCGIEAGSMSVVLGTIRAIESGGDYTIQAAGSTASGAYQMLDTTWAGYSGYARAADAPPEVQDAKAAELVGDVLEQNGGDVSAVPVVWYLGHLPAADSAEWDNVPYPGTGNVLTPRAYQERWLAKYNELLAADPATESTAAAQAPVPGSCFGGSTDPLVGGWALLGPRELIEANPSAMSAPHHDYPALDWMVPVNTPVYAVRGGTVTTVRMWPHNWWTQGCGTDNTGCQTCGVGVTITEADGTRWTYCHGTNLTVSLSDAVAPGQQIMWSGNSGRSGAPHLHIEIHTADDIRRCPQPILQALANGLTPPPPTETTGCFF